MALVEWAVETKKYAYEYCIKYFRLRFSNITKMSFSKQIFRGCADISITGSPSSSNVGGGVGHIDPSENDDSAPPIFIQD